MEYCGKNMTHNSEKSAFASKICVTLAVIKTVKIMYDELRTTVERAWDDRSLLQDDTTKAAIREVVELIDKGLLRTAEPVDLACSQWRVNEWVKKAVILYFPIQKMRTMRAGELEWYDKMDIKHDYDRLGVRAVPHAVARYGAYIAPGGVGIGGVLEPVQAAPVIIEDNCFVGSRAIVVEGAHVCREAVLGSNTVITGSTHIIDVTGAEPVEYRGYVPPRSVVIPGSYAKKFPAGEYSVACALIIGRRKESTDKKTSLNDALRDFGVAV